MVSTKSSLLPLIWIYYNPNWVLCLFGSDKERNIHNEDCEAPKHSKTTWGMYQMDSFQICVQHLLYIFSWLYLQRTLEQLLQWVYQVLASSTKIYIILELATGGELFDKIVRHLACSYQMGISATKNESWLLLNFLYIKLYYHCIFVLLLCTGISWREWFRF